MGPTGQKNFATLAQHEAIIKDALEKKFREMLHSSYYRDFEGADLNWSLMDGEIFKFEMRHGNEIYRHQFQIRNAPVTLDEGIEMFEIYFHNFMNGAREVRIQGSPAVVDLLSTLL